MGGLVVALVATWAGWRGRGEQLVLLGVAGGTALAILVVTDLL